MTKLLILGVSAGNGHVRAAQALEATARQMAAFSEVTHVDAMQPVASSFRTVYADWYLRLVNHCLRIWSVVHQQAVAGRNAAALTALQALAHSTRAACWPSASATRCRP